jgi:hypothetical protein
VSGAGELLPPVDVASPVPLLTPAAAVVAAGSTLEGEDVVVTGMGEESPSRVAVVGVAVATPLPLPPLVMAPVEEACTPSEGESSPPPLPLPLPLPLLGSFALTNSDEERPLAPAGELTDEPGPDPNPSIMLLCVFIGDKGGGLFERSKGLEGARPAPPADSAGRPTPTPSPMPIPIRGMGDEIRSGTGE